MSNCEICPIVATHNGGKDVQIFESKHWRVVLDSNQQFLGKAFVTLLEHKQAVSDLNRAEWEDLRSVMQTLEAAIKKAFQPSHFNWSCLMNIAAMKGQQTHVHWHLHPRYAEAVTINEQTFEDTQWYPRKEKTDHSVDAETLHIVRAKIKECI